jgi:peptide/nickel transport system substrate-binding protein
MKQASATLLVATLFISLSSTMPALSETLRIGLGEDTDTLDPDQGRTFGGRQMFAALCDKLFDLDENAGIVGQLVTDWSVSDDGLAITLTLRPGVMFHDGTQFDAAAVKFNIERSLNLPESARVGDIRSISGVEVVDELTAVLRLHEPFAPLLAQLADRAGMMLSPTAVQAVDTNTFANAPVCSGPYTFKERIVQDRVVVQRFEDHWNKDAYQFDEIIYLPMPDSTVRLNNLLSGQIDIMERVATSDLPRLTENNDVSVVEVTGLGHVHMQFNVASSDPVPSDKKLRQAIEAAIDRNILNDVVFGGAYVPGNQPVAPSSPFYSIAHPVKPADVERAKSLLAEASSAEVNVIINNEPQYLRLGQVVQSMLGSAGITINLQPMEGASALGLMTSDQFQAAIAPWSGRADPDANAYSYLGCEGSSNYGKYCNQEVEALLSEAARVSDVAKRAELYSQAATIWMEDAPVIYLYHEKRFFGLRSNVGGLVLIPDGIIRIGGIKKS